MGSPTEPMPKIDVTRVAEKSPWKANSMLSDMRLSFSTNFTFDEILEGRRTRRTFDKVTLLETCSFINHLFSTRFVGSGEQAGRVLKTFISSGALHPIEIIIISGPDVEEPILFDDRKGKFVTLPVFDQLSFIEAVEEALKILPATKGHLILLTGDTRRLSASYLNPVSLLWRDAGAALQACSIAAYAYGYGFCPLGHTGSAALQALGPPHEDYVALGMAIFGR
ncbi:MAG: hypothetical protein OXU27_04910 [Candidatus Poribacteria bacterium]|nr:hypothetical protein [Candidatus Poribacteria bacterium]